MTSHHDITKSASSISACGLAGKMILFMFVVVVIDTILWQGHHDRVMQLN